MPDVAPIDHAMLAGLKDLLGEKFEQLVSAYIDDCTGRLKRLADAEKVNDLSVIKDESHGIKGSSRNMGANPLADLCAVIEDQARAGDDTDLAQRISAVQQEFAAVEKELNAL